MRDRGCSSLSARKAAVKIQMHKDTPPKYWSPKCKIQCTKTPSTNTRRDTQLKCKNMKVQICVRHLMRLKTQLWHQNQEFSSISRCIVFLKSFKVLKPLFLFCPCQTFHIWIWKHSNEVVLVRPWQTWMKTLEFFVKLPWNGGQWRPCVSTKTSQ